MEKIPIRVIDSSDPTDKAYRDKIVSLVERTIVLHREWGGPINPNDKIQLEREIEATDHQIDQLVYELYGLTEEEIKIVEDTNGSE